MDGDLSFWAHYWPYRHISSIETGARCFTPPCRRASTRPLPAGTDEFSERLNAATRRADDPLTDLPACADDDQHAPQYRSVYFQLTVLLCVILTNDADQKITRISIHSSPHCFSDGSRIGRGSGADPTAGSRGRATRAHDGGSAHR